MILWSIVRIFTYSMHYEFRGITGGESLVVISEIEIEYSGSWLMSIFVKLQSMSISVQASVHISLCQASVCVMYNLVTVSEVSS